MALQRIGGKPPLQNTHRFFVNCTLADKYKQKGMIIKHFIKTWFENNVFTMSIQRVSPHVLTILMVSHEYVSNFTNG